MLAARAGLVSASVKAVHINRAVAFESTQFNGIGRPSYAARIEDLRPGDFVKVDCAACQHVALLTPEALLLSFSTEVGPHP
jgi:hypothetical protein